MKIAWNSLVVVLLVLAVSCKKQPANESQLLLKAEKLVSQQSSEAQIVSVLGKPEVIKSNPTFGRVLQYVTYHGEPEMWHGMKVSGVQIVISDGKAERLFPILSGP